MTLAGLALVVAFVLQAAGADAHRIARAQELGVPLRQLEAQDVLILGERGDRLSRQDDAAGGNGDGEDAAGAGRQHRAFAGLLRDDVAVAAHRREIALGDIEVRFRLVELGLRADAAPRQFGDAIVVCFGLIALRLLRGDARVERLHLQRELLVRHQGDMRARGDGVAFLDREGSDRAADAGAGDELMRRLDRGDDRLAVGDFGRANDISVRRQGSRNADKAQDESQRIQAQRGHSGRGLTYICECI